MTITHTHCPTCNRLIAFALTAAADGVVSPTHCPFCHSTLSPPASARRVELSHGDCKLCGASLTPLEANQGGVCSNQSCQQRRMGAEAADRRRAYAEFKQQMIIRATEMLTEQKDLSPVLPVSVGIVPGNTRSLTPLPEERKQAFLSHLRSMMAEHEQLREVPAAELTSEIPVPLPVEPAPTKEQNAMLGLSCAVCRGHCCRQGITHAFQDVPSMRRIRDTFPQWADAELMAAYAERLPEVSYEGSCVYHTELGCNLPREMRSDMCNTWMCEGQHRWLEELPRDGSVLGYVVATPSYEPQVIRAALVHPSLAAGGSIGLRADSLAGGIP